MEELCKYKDVFGKPNQGVHSFRIFDWIPDRRSNGIAAVDTILTVLLGILLAKLFKINNLSGILLMFGLGIIAHKIFCVDTTINKLLGLTNHPSSGDKKEANKTN